MTVGTMRRKGLQVENEELRTRVQQLEAESEQLRARVQQLEAEIEAIRRQNAILLVDKLEFLATAERARELARKQAEVRRARDRNRKKGLAPPPRQGPPWELADDEQIEAIVLPYEERCEELARERGVDVESLPAEDRVNACYDVAERAGKSYDAVRSILTKMAKKGATFARPPRSDDHL